MKTRIRALLFSFVIAGVALSATFGIGQLFDHKSLQPALFKQERTSKKGFKSVGQFTDTKRHRRDSSAHNVHESPSDPNASASKKDSINIIVQEPVVTLEEPVINEDGIQIDSSGYSDVDRDEIQIEIDTTDLPK